MGQVISTAMWIAAIAFIVWRYENILKALAKYLINTFNKDGDDPV